MMQEMSFKCPFLFSFTNLLFRYLYSNQLNGAIPDSIGNLVMVSQLYVALPFHHSSSYSRLLTSCLAGCLVVW